MFEYHRIRAQLTINFQRKDKIPPLPRRGSNMEKIGI